jgi:serine/threonine protein phosphatase PrpC
VLSNFAPDGSTPLHCAARWGNEDVVQLLLSLQNPKSQGRLVDVWSRDLQGRVPLHLAAEYEHERVCRLLISTMTESSRSSSASSPARESVVGSSAPIDLTGTTPLGWASRRKKGRPLSPIRELLFGQGDNSILPQRQFLERSGKTPIRRTFQRSTSRALLNESELPHSDQIVYAHSEAQGWRPEMEDAIVTCCPLTSDSSSSSARELSQTYWLFGVFDGHGGDFSSRFAANTFPSVVLSSLADSHRLSGQSKPLDPTELERLFRESCLAVDALLSEEERMKVTGKQGSDGSIKLSIRDTSGTTACVCLLTIHDLFLANIGDSRAVLVQSDHTSTTLITTPLSVDQKLSLPDERTRAIAAGCM